jgi:formate-dependent nitrite reductase membrane component NrfD
MPEHFVRAPEWGWWILLYFFFGGLSGGSYALGTLLRLHGGARYQALASNAFIISFATLIVCPIFLTIDLGRPERFSHMLFYDGLNFKTWSPMSMGAWGLLIFGIFSFVSFLEALEQKGRLKTRVFSNLLGGGFGLLWMVLGTAFGLFIAGYTGVLLAVSSQPVWSDTWALGGLFVASALSGAAAAIALFGNRPAAGSTTDAASDEAATGLARADAWFIVLELVLVALLIVSLGRVAAPIAAGMYGIIFWIGAVVLGMLVPLAAHYRWIPVSSPVAVFGLVLLGNLLLRAVIIFAPQS